MTSIKTIEYKGNTLTLQKDRDADCISYEILLRDPVKHWVGRDVQILTIDSSTSVDVFYKKFSDSELASMMQREYDDCFPLQVTATLESVIEAGDINTKWFVVNDETGALSGKYGSVYTESGWYICNESGEKIENKLTENQISSIRVAMDRGDTATYSWEFDD
ncbi:MULTISPECIES: hypothetical protein [Pectobacterium]|uniref:hypothetical protein n=1 Tax=Pectobacterium TaxID=122277 RepID=UPI0010F64FB2|nr:MULTISPECIES: hypothetical protein [Pectobacterium]MCA6962437.1 hypothetical protein [Pectobacterium odoriferum]MCH5010533.1 hypothetical protein [Pectobacterium odoriferum]TKY81035.1 hypothetical protein EDI29_17670 [Pectobacterium polonicum]